MEASMMVRSVGTKQQRAMKLVNNPVLIKRALFDRSFFKFFVYMWPAISQDKLELNWHIEAICNEVQHVGEVLLAGEDKEYDLSINVPPGTTKTSIVSVAFPVWLWTRKYTLNIITASYSQTLALANAEKSRDLINSDRFQEIYPDFKLREEKHAKGDYQITRAFRRTEKRTRGYAETRLGGSRYSTSVGGSLTGRHGHIIILDDANSADDIRSDRTLYVVNEWYDNTLSTRKASKTRTPTINIQQRLHQNDLTGHLSKKKIPIRKIVLPGQIRDYEEYVRPVYYKQFYSEDGLLDPNRMGWKVLQQMEEELGQYGYAGQIGQNPTPPEGGMFKADRVVKITSMPPPMDIDKVVRYWDKAGTKEQKGVNSAYTVGVKMAKLTNGKFLIMDVVRGRWSSDDRERMIKLVAEADGKKVPIYHEQEPGSGGKQSAELTTRMLAGWHAEADRPIGDKIYRADAFSVQVNSGNVLMYAASWNDAYIEELELFPLSTYKDQVDASSGAFSKLVGKRKVKNIR